MAHAHRIAANLHVNFPIEWPDAEIYRREKCTMNTCDDMRRTAFDEEHHLFSVDERM